MSRISTTQRDQPINVILITTNSGVLLPRIESDLVPILHSCIDGTLGETEIKLSPEPSVCVVMASGGYPKNYEKGKKITGLESFKDMGHTTIFHAGTSNQNGELITMAQAGL